MNKIRAYLSSLNRHPILIKVTFAILALVYLFFVVQRAWVSDDAYITLRTVDNFLHGYRLTWNTFERVQAFTHPLWMFVLSAGIALTREYFYTTLVISVLLCIATLGVLFRFSLKSFSATLLVFSLLITSNAYLDYSTSGLDNALSHFLVALFFLLLVQLKPSRRKLFWVSWVASCGLFNRIDTGILFLPGILYLLYENRSFKDWWLVVVAQGPFIAWELFSLFYYGFPFPNTAYAKLYTNIAKEAIVRQGWLYLYDTFTWDTITLTACLIAFIFAIKSANKVIHYVIPVSMGLFIFYDIQIGGDFMRGRFLTLPLLCAALIILTTQDKYISRFGFLIAVVFILTNINSPYPFYKANVKGKAIQDGIVDERGYYWSSTSLSKKLTTPENEFPAHQWAREGKNFRINPPQSGSIVISSTGMVGFFAGPSVRIIDDYGLSDPLLARLPVDMEEDWRIGHFRRTVPDGYLKTVATGNNTITDPKIAAYYAKLQIITQAEIFAPGRIETILAMNFGAYEYLIREDQ